MKITIDVTDEECAIVKTSIHPYGCIIDKVLTAYEAEKNKIQVGDWHYQSGERIWKALDETEAKDANQNMHKRLSQPLQDLLKKEIICIKQP